MEYKGAGRMKSCSKASLHHEPLSSFSSLMQTRTFAAVLFRRISTKTRKDAVTNEAKELFSTLTAEQRLVIRQKLVTCLTTESVTDVRKKIGDAVAEIARQYTDNGMHHGRTGRS
jgi:hypothetical protein